MTSGPRVVVALDVDSAARAEALARALSPALCRLKVGKEVFTRCGPGLVERLAALGYDVFLDLKYHDIPNTVAGAVRAAADLGVWMVNVHALGGRRMMEAAREALAGRRTRPLLIAVTVLTSHREEELEEVGVAGGIRAAALRLADLARACGLDGLVCSPLEVAELRRRFGPQCVLVTPGVRPAGSATADQRRIATPAAAVAAGADYLVVGRPVTQADDPLQALRTIVSEISGVVDG